MYLQVVLSKICNDVLVEMFRDFSLRNNVNRKYVKTVANFMGNLKIPIAVHVRPPTR